MSFCGAADWRDDLRGAFKSAGAAGKDVALIFSDTQIVWEGMLEDINNVLNTGEVPNLLKPEDLEEISTALRPAMVAEGLAVAPAGIAAYFTRRVRARLHLVIAMSPLGEAFRRRLRMFPALVNCCTIDWFREWPLDALQSVAHHFYRVRMLTENCIGGANCLIHELASLGFKYHLLGQLGRLSLIHISEPTRPY